MEAIGRDLVEFWTFTAEKGLMNGNTAGSLRGACREVLTAVEGDNWENVDLRSLDVDDVVQRFERLRMAKFKPSSLSVYKSRFRNAVQMYLAYLNDPSGWRYTAERPARDRKRASQAKAPGEAASTNSTLVEPPPAPPGVTLIEYPFPLRPGLVIKMWLPEDMTHREAERLGGYLKSLAYEAPKELTSSTPTIQAVGQAS